ncbi:MAG: hypothetical protein WCP45_04180, partial [Verrucomicrobiota bacterium]
MNPWINTKLSPQPPATSHLRLDCNHLATQIAKTTGPVAEIGAYIKAQIIRRQKIPVEMTEHFHLPALARPPAKPPSHGRRCYCTDDSPDIHKHSPPQDSRWVWGSRTMLPPHPSSAKHTYISPQRSLMKQKS